MSTWRLVDGLTGERIRRWTSEALWLAMGQTVAVTGSVVGVRLLTEVLPPDAYGELALGMTAGTLLQQLVFGPLGNGATRFYSVACDANALPAYLAAVRRMVLTATVWILGGAAVAVAGMAAGGLTRWVGLGVAALGFALLSGCNAILDGIQNAARQRAVVAWHQGMATWGRYLAAAGMILAVGASSAAAIWGYLLAMVAVLLSQAWFFRYAVTPGIVTRPARGEDIEQWRAKIFSYSSPFATWGIFTWAHQASDRWALGLFGSTQEVGYYVVLFQLGYYPIMLASGMLVQLIGPVLFQRAGDALDPAGLEQASILNYQVVRLVGITTAACFLAALWFQPWIFKVFVASKYAAAAYLLPWMICSGGIFAIGQLVSLQLMTELRAHHLIAPKVISAILGIGLNVMGAVLYGVAGVVAASILGSSAYWMLVHTRSVRAKRHTARA